MLILLIRSHCKICPLPTIVSSAYTQDRHCWQWANFTMGPDEQNQQKQTFCGKNEEKAVAKLNSDRL